MHPKIVLGIALSVILISEAEALPTFFSRGEGKKGKQFFLLNSHIIPIAWCECKDDKDYTSTLDTFLVSTTH